MVRLLNYKNKLFKINSFSYKITKWSRRVSNPRPNKEQLRFLHVYFVIGFRNKSEHKHPNLPLVS